LNACITNTCGAKQAFLKRYHSKMAAFAPQVLLHRNEFWAKKTRRVMRGGLTGDLMFVKSSYLIYALLHLITIL
jgi:hypothetical protein